MIRLGVNIDHVATLRNARGGVEPDPLQAALIAEAYGADGITAHLREDRRHITDADIRRLKNGIKTQLNLEMAATSEMLEIALTIMPAMVTLVPERREELTTEGGLNVVHFQDELKKDIRQLSDAGILVSLFVDPDLDQLNASRVCGAHYVELHTGEYANAFLKGGAEGAFPALQTLTDAADATAELGLKLNAGHGLTYDNVEPILKLPGLIELNIGHNIIAHAVFVGLGPAVEKMKRILSGLA